MIKNPKSRQKKKWKVFSTQNLDRDFSKKRPDITVLEQSELTDGQEKHQLNRGRFLDLIIKTRIY